MLKGSNHLDSGRGINAEYIYRCSCETKSYALKLNISIIAYFLQSISDISLVITDTRNYLASSRRQAISLINDDFSQFHLTRKKASVKYFPRIHYLISNAASVKILRGRGINAELISMLL